MDDECWGLMEERRCSWSMGFIRGEERREWLPLAGFSSRFHLLLQLPPLLFARAVLTNEREVVVKKRG